jgi:hypothetical protein
MYIHIYVGLNIVQPLPWTIEYECISPLEYKEETYQVYIYILYILYIYTYIYIYIYILSGF